MDQVLSRRSPGTKYLCACSTPCARGRTQRHICDHVRSSRHSLEKGLPDPFTSTTSSLLTNSPDTTCLCHAAGLAYSRRSGTTYTNLPVIHRAERPPCTYKPTPEALMQHTTSPPTCFYHDLPYHTCVEGSNQPDSMDHDEHDHWSWQQSKCQVSMDETAFPQTSPMQSSCQSSSHTPHRHTTPCPRRAAHSVPSGSMAGPATLDHFGEFQQMESLQPDPTLCTELPLVDFDLFEPIQTPWLPTTATSVPQISDFSTTNMTTRNGDGSSLMDLSTPIPGGNWDNRIPDDWGDQMDLWNSTANAPFATVSDYNGLDLDLIPPEYEQSSNAAGLDLFLPELPASPDTQFDFFDGPQMSIEESAVANCHYQEAASLTLPLSQTDYPDPEDIHAPFPSTPGLTSSSTTPSKHHGSRTAQRDTSMDAQLLQLRRQGKSYREIKEILGLDEAESTLRGRFRTLSKPREARVRKPEWSRQDVSRTFLLKGSLRY
jgi:hypothetical protein